MNPLENDDVFQLSMANPNPTSSKTKDGPIYRISVEVTREEWDWFMDTETKGMVIECEALVSHRNTPARDPHTEDAFTGQTDDEKKKGGPLSQRSDSLARDPEFLLYLRDRHPNWAKSKCVDGARAFIRTFCKVDTRAALDHDSAAAKRFGKIISDYIDWGAGDGGTG
jgi:hypothetical protein